MNRRSERDPSGLEDEVARLRAAVLRRHGLTPGQSVPQRASARAVERLAQVAVVNAHWGLASSLPYVGRVVVLAQRAIRIGLRWYINPIVEQQNRFNRATLAALHAVIAENDELRARVAEQASSTRADDESLV